jgi:hypothetical protein
LERKPIGELFSQLRFNKFKASQAIFFDWAVSSLECFLALPMDRLPGKISDRGVAASLDFQLRESEGHGRLVQNGMNYRIGAIIGEPPAREQATIEV